MWRSDTDDCARCADTASGATANRESTDQCANGGTCASITLDYPTRCRTTHDERISSAHSSANRFDRR